MGSDVWDEGVDGDDLVWHYTTVDALIGILTNHEVWASHILHMNDPQEGAFLRVFQDCVDNGPSAPDPRQFLDHDDYGYAVGSAFAISASKESDSLPMWREYGRSQYSYAIALDRQAPLSVIGDTECGLPSFFGWADVDYGFEAVVERHGKWYDAHESDVIPFEESTASFRALLYDTMFMVKDSAFEYESEVRFGVSGVPRSLWNWREGAFGLTPYLRLTGVEPSRLASFDMGCSPVAHKPYRLPVRAVRCAPGAPRSSAISVRKLLEANGYVDDGVAIPVTRSSCRFNWAR